MKVAISAALLLSAAASEQKPARLEVELSPAERAREVVEVLALDRDVPQKMAGRTVSIRTVAGRKVEGAPGRWVIEPLRPGRYDLYVRTRRGSFEGYALRPEEESEAPVTERDRAKIAEIFKHLKTFEEHKRILDLGGNGRQAVALVELLRTGKTSYSRKAPGACIWRVEYWRFNKLYGVWRKGGYQVLRRLQAPKREFATWNWNFIPELGGLGLKPGESGKVRWTIPESFDPARGRAVAGQRAPPGAADEPAKETEKQPRV